MSLKITKVLNLFQKNAWGGERLWSWLTNFISKAWKCDKSLHHAWRHHEAHQRMLRNSNFVGLLATCDGWHFRTFWSFHCHFHECTKRTWCSLVLFTLHCARSCFIVCDVHDKFNYSEQCELLWIPEILIQVLNFKIKKINECLRKISNNVTKAEKDLKHFQPQPFCNLNCGFFNVDAALLRSVRFHEEQLNIEKV